MSTIEPGTEGPAVRALQKKLNAVLQLAVPLKADGDYGGKTRAAVVEAQRRLGLPVTGIADAATLARLDERLTPATPDIGFPSEPTWMAVAAAEIGQREVRGGENPRIVEYHQTTSYRARTDEVPWCASFVNWVLGKAGYKGTGSAGASSFLKWGRELEVPRPGCVVVIKQKRRTADHASGTATGYHVGFFVSSDADGITLLGGNQGDTVKRAEFSLAKWDVRAYRWPA
jgi:uncharacterized protein (TIGR02594 family)